MKRLALSAVLSFTGFAFVATTPASAPDAQNASPQLTPEVQALEFMLDAPDADSLGKKYDFWATYYHMPTIQAAAPNSSDATPFIGRNGQAISFPISDKDWCYAALQGSVRVEAPDGSSKNYVFVDAKGPEQINCDTALGNLTTRVKVATRRARFAPFEHPAGCDVRPKPLIPYRTIAVDTKKIKRGTVFYIPDLRGEIFYKDDLPYAHDGFVVANDRGGAIKNNHIDVFVEDIEQTPFPNIIGSNPNHTFTAYPVKGDHPALKALKQADARICDEIPADPVIGNARRDDTDWNAI